MTLSRNSIKERKIFEYHVGQAFFHQVDPGLEVFLMFCQGVSIVGRSLLSRDGLTEDIEFI